MAVQSKLIEVLPAEYGYVVFTAVGSVFVNIWMVLNVVKARKQYNVKLLSVDYPAPIIGRCIIGAPLLQTMSLENYPSFLLLLLFGGFQYPKISAGAGVVYLVSRIAYACGYYTGDPDKRRWGSFGGIGLICLLGNTISFAAHQLKLVGKC